MSKEFSFSVMPTVSISRSRFARKSQHKTSLTHGLITPIYLDEVLPGDTRSIDMASLVRMSTPIAPIMDNVVIDYHAFFVPNRLLWDHWVDFMGENRESAGIPSQSYIVPYLTINGLDKNGASVSKGSAISLDSLADHFGLNAFAGGKANGSGAKTINVSALPFRAYYLIYNEWYRNQNIIAPIAVQTGDTNEAIISQGASINNYDLCKAAKMADYFTKALPYAQKGQAVSIPLGTTAPVVARSGLQSTISSNVYHRLNYMLSASNASSTANVVSSLTTAGVNLGESGEALISGPAEANKEVFPAFKTGDLVADLSTATAATINQLRYAFQLQKLFEKDSLFGSRYYEILAAHFGVRSPDARLQRPEYLGGFRQHVNIDQVLSTAGYASSSSSTVGAPGANSVTAGKSSLFTKSFVEHGYLMIVAVPRHEHTYTSGINRMWSRKDRYDFYFPVFANLGAQDVKFKELDARVAFASTDDGYGDNEDVFGYQEAWAEYRYKPSLATGLLNPIRSVSLNYWTLADSYDIDDPVELSRTFIEEQRTELSRALVTGVSGPDYIADFYFLDVAVRPMPTYSIPGLIDHH